MHKASDVCATSTRIKLLPFIRKARMINRRASYFVVVFSDLEGRNTLDHLEGKAIAIYNPEKKFESHEFIALNDQSWQRG